MPNRTDWIAPDLAFRLRDGRPVYHCYRNDEVNPNDCCTVLQYHFTLSMDSEDEETGRYAFDYRDLMNVSWGAKYSGPPIPEAPQYDLEMAVAMCVIQRAYDEGRLTVPEST